MIGRLTGSVVEIDGDVLLLDVAGVGYEVEASASACALAQTADAPLTLYTHFVVREDAQLLFGFGDRAERELFRAFIKISGVGPKLGLALISSLTPADLALAVHAGDASVLTRVPGVGKKTAERLLVELKNRAEVLREVEPRIDVELTPLKTASGAAQEAEDALVALGYRPQDASRAVAAAVDAAGEDAATEALVRLSLRSFARDSGVGTS